MPLDPHSIITMGHIVKGGTTSAINLAALGYIVTIEEEVIPGGGGSIWTEFPQRKLIKVTIICPDGMEYYDEAYTTDMSASVDDVEITITNGIPDVKFGFLGKK